MKKYLSLFSLALILAFGGCGGSSSGSGNGAGNKNGPGNGEKVVIDSKQKAVNSFAIVGNGVDAIDIVNDAGDAGKYLNGVGGVGVDMRTHDTRIVTVESFNGEKNCSVSGKVTYTVSVDDSVNPALYDLSVHFAACKEDMDQQYDGNLAFHGTESDMNLTFDNFTKTENGDSEVLNAHVKVRKSSDTTGSVTVTDGTFTQHLLNGTHTMTFDNFVMDYDESDNSAAINGKLAVSSVPVSCIDGSYTVKTVERIVEDADDNAISGKVKINDTLYTFNADATVTATINGQPVTFDQNHADINCTAAAQ